MPVFNNLVLFDQHKEKNALDMIVPDLAESWTWSEDGKELTFKLRHGVNWHDGKPFTPADVKCTWDLLQGKTQEKLRLNPRKAWYRNLEEDNLCQCRGWARLDDRYHCLGRVGSPRQQRPADRGGDAQCQHLGGDGQCWPLAQIPGAAVVIRAGLERFAVR